MMKHIYIQHPEPEHIGYCWKCEEAKEHPSHYVIEHEQVLLSIPFRPLQFPDAALVDLEKE